MLKSSICTSIRILTVLLLVADVTATKRYHSTINSSLRRYSRNSSDVDYIFEKQLIPYLLVRSNDPLNFLTGTNVTDTSLIVGLLERNYNIQGVINSLNQLQISAIYNINHLLLDSMKLVLSLNLYVKAANQYNLTTDTIFIEKKLPALRTEESRRNNVVTGYAWKKRSLCGVSEVRDDYARKLFNDESTVNDTTDNKERIEYGKTLLDYEGPAAIDEIEDRNSLEAHKRVKRSQPEYDVLSSFANEPGYLRELANSFPRDSYGDNDNALSDTKREIPIDDVYLSKNTILDAGKASPPAIALFDNGETRTNDSMNSVELLSLADVVTNGPSSIGKEYVIGEKENLDNGKERDSKLTLQQSSENNYDFDANQKSNGPDLGTPEVLEDPMLALALIRKKRNYADVQRTENQLEEEADLLSPEADFETHSVLSKSKKDRAKKKVGIDKTHMNKAMSAARPAHVQPSRNSRKTEVERHSRNSKNKRQKRPGKTQKVRKNNALLYKKRYSNRLKNHEVRNVGGRKTSIRIENDGRRRRGNSRVIRKLTANHHSFSKNNGILDPVIVKKRSGNSFDTAKVAEEPHRIKTNTFRDAKLVRDKRKNIPLAPNEMQNGFVSNQRLVEGTKSRTKRDKNEGENHEFQNEMDELKYYQNVREPETAPVQCANDEEMMNAKNHQLDDSSAVRSVGEVKELAKRLVAKVNELQNYLHSDGVKTNERNERKERKIEVRAIDDLCSNVSTACAVFKEAPKIVQRCAPSTHREFTSTSKVTLGTKVNSDGRTNNRNRFHSEKEERSVEGKRSTEKEAGKTSFKKSSTVPRAVKKKPRHKWGRWTDWSSCSVTCGKGRQIRWRYCLNDCANAETEMEEKACQLPACPPGKFLGIF